MVFVAFISLSIYTKGRRLIIPSDCVLKVVTWVYVR